MKAIKIHSRRAGRFNKQVLRSRVSNGASYVEIYLSAIILLGILLLSFTEVIKIVEIVRTYINGGEMMTVTDFLAIAFELIIGVEFIKMLAKHTPSATVDVLLFAVARQIIVSHDNMLNVVFGVAAIGLLFAIRKYLGEVIHQQKENQYLVNGGTTIPELNKRIRSRIDASFGNTVSGVIYNVAKERDELIEPGYIVQIDEYEFQVYSMDEHLIKQVKIRVKEA